MPKRTTMIELWTIHIQILEYLAICTFLTIPHFLALEICCKRYLSTKLKELRECWWKPLIWRIKYGKKGGGRRPYYYYLTEYGRLVLWKVSELSMDQIKIPWKYPHFALDYTHRFQYLSFVIYVLQWAKYTWVELARFDHYFDRTKGKRRITELESRTRIDLPLWWTPAFIEPDGAFVVHTSIGEKLYLFELHRGHDAKRIIEQIKRHSIVIRMGLAMKKYAFEKNNRVIIVFEQKKTQEAVIRRLQGANDVNQLENFFICKNLEEPEQLQVEYFADNWTNLQGEQVTIY